MLVRPDPNVRVSPSDCAVCVAVPLDRDAFFAAADPNRFDWIPNWCLRSFDSHLDPTGAAWETYQRLGYPKFLRALLDLAARLGAAVAPETTLSDLRAALHTHPVVILIAHWASHRVAASDVLDPKQLLSIVQDSNNWTHAEIRKSLSMPTFDDLRAGIATALNRLIDASRSHRESQGRKVTAGDPPLRDGLSGSGPADLARPWLEYVLRPALLESAPLELRSGMHRASDVIEYIPRIPCVLDLSACNTTELTQILTVERRNCRAIAPFHGTTVSFGVHVIGKTLQILTKRPGSYLNARVQALNDLKQLAEACR